jgi:hypothetical protein
LSTRNISRRYASVMFLCVVSALVSMQSFAAEIIVGVPSINPEPGQQFEVDISIDAGSEVLGSYDFHFLYNPAVVNIVSISGGQTPEFVQPPATNPSSFLTGETPLAATNSSLVSPSGMVHVATITVVAVGIATESSNLGINVMSINNALVQPIPFSVSGSSVFISYDPMIDADSDGLTNVEEIALGTDANNPDSDGDGLLDGFESNAGLDPLDNGGNDPLQGALGDPDNDGLTNEQEQTHGTNPSLRDSDNDGLDDNVELSLSIDPTNSDSDGDGLPDGFEVNSGINPNDNGSIDPNNGASGDPDLDQLTNAEELDAGTNATIGDTDSDGLPDGFEVNGGLDPLDDGTGSLDNGATGDPDNDGLDNASELAAGTSPTTNDTDNDGLPDGFEDNNYLNPLDDGSVDANQGALGDPDNDTHTNLSEYQIGSDPNDLYSQPIDIQIQLTEGFQPLSYPLSKAGDFGAFDLLLAVDSGYGYVFTVKTFENGSATAIAYNQGPAGDNFLNPYGSGVLADVSIPLLKVFRGPVQCQSLNLVSGINIIGLSCMPSGYSAFQMLVGIGDQSVVSMIQKYNLDAARYESAMYSTGVPAGVDFPIRIGEAYIVHMKLDRLNFDPLQ